MASFYLKTHQRKLSPAVGITGLGAIIEACSHGQANAYPVIVEWLFTLDTETAKQLLTTAAQSSR